MEPEPSSEVVLFQEQDEVKEELTYFARKNSNQEDDVEIYADQEMEV